MSSGLLIVLLLTALWTADALGAYGMPSKEKKAAQSASDAFFNEPQLRVFRIRVSDSALFSLRQQPRTYVRATVMEGDTVLTDVGLHLKGMGSFRTVDEKPSFAVKFDEFTTNQEYRGVTKLMLNNSVQDPTFLAELLATDLFRRAGVPAARVTHARVELNGRDLGLYVAIEAMNKRFLKQHFTSAKGNLYEAYLDDIGGNLEQDNGDDTSRADLRALHKACLIPDPGVRWPQLNKVLDVDRFVSFAAMEMLVSHWDGYAIHTNNYRIYHDPETARMVFITHGLDWAFKRPNISIQPPGKGLVARAVLTTPQGLGTYRQRVGELFTNVFRVADITNRIEGALAKIRTGQFAAQEIAHLERRAMIMGDRVLARAASISNQLAGIPPQSLPFDAQGMARLTSWRDEPDRGDPVMDQPQREGKPLLHIGARGPRTRASWRSQVHLPPGLYRFEGMVRLDSRNGSARLRISGDTQVGGIGGTTSWRMLSHTFEVRDPGGMDVECVCEFNGSQGDAWFDATTLVVRRITRPALRPPVNQRLLLR